MKPTSRSVVGMDVFIESPLGPNELGASLMELTHDTPLSLKLVSSRGTKVFPPTGAITDTVDHYRCRFIIKESPGDLSDDDVHRLLVAISRRHRWMHIEKLRSSTANWGSRGTRARTERGRAAPRPPPVTRAPSVRDRGDAGWRNGVASTATNPLMNLRPVAVRSFR